MLIWVLFAGMTAVAVLIALVPALVRRPAPALAVEAGEVSVYRDQLAEIDRDLDAGLIGAAEAEAARAEISRRILRAGRAGGETSTAAGSRLLPIVAAVAIPLVAAGLYAKLGHPSLPDMPLSGRQAETAAGSPSIEDLVAQAEARLAANPDDTKGWDVLAPTYMRLGRLEKAAAAWRNAIRSGGPNERRLNGLGLSLMQIADDVVTPEARSAFEKSLEIEPRGILPRFYLAVALMQEGRNADAVAAWKALLALSEGGESWVEDARRGLADAEALLAGRPVAVPGVPPEAAAPSAPSAAAPAPGPSAADIGAAAQMSPEERAKMISDMVDRLDTRLTAAGGPIEDWERLIRSQRILGRSDAAAASLARARAAFTADPAALARLDALAGGRP